MRVLFIASYPESVLQFRGDLIRELVKRGIEVHVALPRSGQIERVREQLTRASVSVHYIPLKRTGLNPFSDALTLLSLVRLMRQCRPDVVFSYTVKPVIYGSISAWVVGVPLRAALITGLGYAFAGPGRGLRFVVQFLVRSLYRLALSKTHVVFFQNVDDLALFQRLRVVRKPTRTVVLNGSGVNLLNFPATPLSSRPMRFLMIARLLGDKGVREYIAAARLVRDRFPEVVFQLVGWIDENPDAIRKWELDEWVKDGVVTYCGRLDDVRGALVDSTVFVLPSYREGTPRTVLEAMAIGRPVITTDAPGCRETVIDGKNGFLVPTRDVDALVGAMTKFILNPEHAEHMGRCARAMAEERFDVEKVNAVILRELGIW